MRVKKGEPIPRIQGSKGEAKTEPLGSTENLGRRNSWLPPYTFRQMVSDELLSYPKTTVSTFDKDDVAAAIENVKARAVRCLPKAEKLPPEAADNEPNQ